MILIIAVLILIAIVGYIGYKTDYVQSILYDIPISTNLPNAYAKKLPPKYEYGDALILNNPFTNDEYDTAVSLIRTDYPECISEIESYIVRDVNTCVNDIKKKNAYLSNSSKCKTKYQNNTKKTATLQEIIDCTKETFNSIDMHF